MAQQATVSTFWVTPQQAEPPVTLQSWPPLWPPRSRVGMPGGPPIANPHSLLDFLCARGEDIVDSTLHSKRGSSTTNNLWLQTAPQLIYGNSACFDQFVVELAPWLAAIPVTSLWNGPLEPDPLPACSDEGDIHIALQRDFLPRVRAALRLLRNHFAPGTVHGEVPSAIPAPFSKVSITVDQCHAGFYLPHWDKALRNTSPPHKPDLLGYRLGDGVMPPPAQLLVPPQHPPQRLAQTLFPWHSNRLAGETSLLGSFVTTVQNK
ncbi:hypothetical protein DACRYDRAFT_109145 [Dacryopinax primogenitus]|uniref:Uncharacterized protein n=1 Tax=Dacryopinax primogenitus (strain DJM 731) TaxID=1858805 RepID=M5G9F4_DACPD|nr:uncharacterized protein DACRYDRAFT_109145 [Dacryopinax primogenitus]EJU00423.1 hypothetical protein DACRYDRAFT_109145 [Dacryopinax primogenitus]